MKDDITKSRLPIRLRWWLAGFLLLAVIAAFSYSRRDSDREELLQDLVDAGVSYSHPYYGDPYSLSTWRAYLPGSKEAEAVNWITADNHGRLTPELMSRMKMFDELQFLTIKGQELPPESYYDLDQFQRLGVLSISQAAIDENSFEAISNLPRLNSLHLDHLTLPGEFELRGVTFPALYRFSLIGTDVTDDFFADPKRFPALGEVTLNSKRTTNQAVKHFANITTITRLNLIGEQYTDEVLETAEGIPSLNVLHLLDTAITDEARDRFRESRPNVILVIEDLPTDSPFHHSVEGAAE
ncbi:MAG: hypothetical protein CMJ46_14505 [Planctomyces sp.]|nr:hypothetical protein [Planctomyces sp.]